MSASFVRITAALFMLGFVSAVIASDPEDERLPSKTFRRGLKQLGLTDLLDFYIREFPPQDPVEAELLRRELRLNLYSDPTVAVSERLQALADATDILRNLIGSHPDDERQFEWQLALGRDLVARKAEPYYNNIMFRGGTAQDREQLAAITAEALQVYDRLVEGLTQAVEQIDSYGIKEFEKRARSGYIERIESLLPRARYFSMWASFSFCLTLPPGDAQRSKRLNEILDYLIEESKLTGIEHDISHYQAQSLLLAGMAYRLLLSSDKAEQFLSKAGFIASTLPNYTERHNLKWVITLAELERIKNLRDTRRFDNSLRMLRSYRGQLPLRSPGTYNLQFALALLEGTIYSAQAASLSDRDVAGKDRLLLQSRRPLIELARSYPQYQNEIYRALFDLLGDVQDPAKLDPFEQNVYVAGLLRQAGELNSQLKQAKSKGQQSRSRQLESNKKVVLSKAVQIAHVLLEGKGALASELRPEILFNLAVCHYEQGEVIEAVKRFLEVVETNPQFEKSRSAADYAVRLCEALYSKSNLAGRRVMRPHFLEALKTMTRRFPDTAQAQRQQYSYARLLQEEDQYEEAAEQYRLVRADHPKQLEALFHIAECNLVVLRQLVGKGSREGAISWQADVTVDRAARFRKQLGRPGSDILRRYLAESLIISAEAHMLRPSIRSEEALELLNKFEEQFPDESDLIGRAMRIRILAHQDLGHLEKAAAIIPEYIRRDPRSAGPTLQGLLQTFKDEIEMSRRQGSHQQAILKARDALLVAKSLYEWVSSSDLDAGARFSFKLEYGEALLRADSAAEALELFRDAVDQDASRRPDGRCHSGRAIHGLAESCYRLQKFEEALSHFTRLFQDSPEDNHLWWRAFLRVVQCRHKLGQDPQILYNLIEQKRVFFPRLGGIELKKEFEQLQRELKSD